MDGHAVNSDFDTTREKMHLPVLEEFVGTLLGPLEVVLGGGRHFVEALAIRPILLGSPACHRTPSTVLRQNCFDLRFVQERFALPHHAVVPVYHRL